MSEHKTILVTGGRGMVGQNLQQHQKAKEWTIVAPTSDELDLADTREVDAFLRSCRPLVVIHAAGRVGGIQANMADPVGFLDQNVAIGRNVIMGAYRAGVQNLINLASTCMYPRDGLSPLREETILSGPLEPTNEGYALAKIIATRLCEYIRRQDGNANYKTLIPCNLYGEHDKFDPKHSHLLPAIIHKIHAAKKTGDDQVEIWGDGTVRREFMFVADLADAVWRAVDTISDLPGEMNVGMGHDFTINEYYETVARVVGWRGSFHHDLTKPVGMKQKLCSIDRQTAWGWSPSTSLEEGITRTYHYYLESKWA
jgi:GDP-L-fucose synthase